MWFLGDSWGAANRKKEAIMRKKNYKGRCEKRSLEKFTTICRTYDAVQYAYADILVKNKDVTEVRCNYTQQKNSLTTAYTMMLQAKYCDGEGQLLRIIRLSINSDISTEKIEKCRPTSFPGMASKITRRTVVPCLVMGYSLLPPMWEWGCWMLLSAIFTLRMLVSQ